MSEKRFNLTIVLCHLILLIPLLLRLLLLLFHWYTPEQDNFFCLLEPFCMAGSAALILALPKNDLPFHAIWLSSFFSCMCYLIDALLLNLLTIYLYIDQFGSITGHVSGHTAAVVIYRPISQFWYYPFAAAICAILGAIYPLFSDKIPKLPKLSRNFFWSCFFFCVFVLPTIFVYLLPTFFALSI